MPNSRIPSPARSQGVISTPRQQRFTRSRSVASPARSNTSTKLSCIIEQHRLESFTISPVRTRRSVLSDKTDIDIPRRQSWWKRLDENSRDVTKVLENAEPEPKQVENVEEYIEDEILSQEKRNYTIDLPESSDSESISSIVIPQRKLFTHKDNLQTEKLFNNVMKNRDNFALRKSKSVISNNKTITVGKKELFNRVTKEQNKPIFPANLLNISVDKTLPNKTAEIEHQKQARNLFGNRAGTKRKNMFAEFIVSESEDEIPDIQPKIFGFTKKNAQQQEPIINRKPSIIQVQNTSLTSNMSNVEMEDWKLLPSSTMVENQFNNIEDNTPVKKVRLSDQYEIGVNTRENSISAVNKSKELNRSLTVKNALKSKLTNDKQFILSQYSGLEDINESNKSKVTKNNSNQSLMRNNKSKNVSNNVVSINIMKNTNNKLDLIELREELQNATITQNSSNSSQKDLTDTSEEKIVNDNEDENNFTLQYENDEDIMAENIVEKNNISSHHEDVHKPSCSIEIQCQDLNSSLNVPEVQLHVNEDNGKRSSNNSHNLNDDIKNDKFKDISTNLAPKSNESRGNYIDDDTRQHSIGVEVIQKDASTSENREKSNNENEYHNYNDEYDQIVENQERVADLEENVDKNMKENSNNSENGDEDDNIEENDEENINGSIESRQSIIESEENVDESKINVTEIDADDQEDDVDNEEEDKSEDDNAGSGGDTEVEQDDDEDKTNATAREENYTTENENRNYEDVIDDGHDSNDENPEDENEDVVDNAEMQYESDEDSVKENTITFEEVSSRMVGDDVTAGSDHDARMKRQSTLEMYLLNMKKANMEKRLRVEEAIRNSLRAPPSFRETNQFKVPAKPKSSLRPKQIKPIQAKPKVKLFSPLENLPEKILEDLKYKPPRRYQPNNASWITKRLYKFLEDKLEPKYDYKARVRAERLVETINDFARELRRQSVAPHAAVERLKAEMARLDVVKTHYDFYEFFHEYMPREIRVKVVPDIVNKISLPRHGVFSDIISD